MSKQIISKKAQNMVKATNKFLKAAYDGYDYDEFMEVFDMRSNTLETALKNLGNEEEDYLECTYACNPDHEGAPEFYFGPTDNVKLA